MKLKPLYMKRTLMLFAIGLIVAVAPAQKKKKPDCDIMPVTFVSIDAQEQNDVLRVSFKVADQINMKKYVVYVSEDGKNWQPLMETEAKANVSDYSLQHKN